MESVDMNKLEKAIIYMERITDGNNPINNLPMPEDALLNNPNVIRCMFFVKEILEEVKRNKGYIGKKGRSRGTKDFPVEALDSFSYIEDKPITKFVAQINEAIDLDTYKKLNYKVVTQWLKENEFLYEVFSEEVNKTVTMPTKKGLEMGITSEKKVGIRGGEYIVVIYGKEAQEYIVQALKKIIGGED